MITDMNKVKRVAQCNKMLQAGMKNLFQSQDVHGITEFSIKIIEILMLLEREEYLKSEAGREDIGNGSYQRSFKALQPNSLMISIPRTRSGKFSPLAMEIIKKQQGQVNQFALLLYRKGMSSRDVSHILEEFFGESMSYDTVNNLAESFHKIRKQWEAQQLDSYYKVVYCDALYIPLKRLQSYSKEAVHVIFGVKEDNTRELLLVEVNPTEGAEVWGEYYEKLKMRGVEQIDLIVADGLKGLSDAIRPHFPGADFQSCVVHRFRNVLKKIRPKEKNHIAYELKEVFNNFDTAASVDKARRKLVEFCNRWRNFYPAVATTLLDGEVLDYFTYVKYPVEVRKMIYTTNGIENLNRQIRKVTDKKVTFDKVENLLDLVFMVVKDFEINNWQKYPVYAFKYWEKNTLD